jgi:hypothetical protein
MVGTVLTIRREQFGELSTARGTQFERQLKAHARGFAPQLCRAAGELGVSELVRLSIFGAHQHGWSDRELTQFYLELALTFGAGFVGDPQYPWLSELLLDPLCSASTRAQLIHSEVIRYLNAVVGKQGGFSIQAFTNFNRALSSAGQFALPSHPADLARRAQAIYPEKLTYLGADGFASVQTVAERAIESFDVDPQQGCALLIVAMLLFGTGVLSDPMYPWFNSVLRDRRITSPSARLARAERKLLRYVLIAGSNIASGKPTG